MARIVLSTFGSLGDLHPYLALGRELGARGHHVVVATLGAYRDRVLAEGLEFHASRPDFDPADKEALRRAMDARTGPEYVVRDVVLANLRASTTDALAAAAGADLIVTHPLALGMLLAARASRRPWISVALAPLSLFSTLDAPIYSGVPFGETLARFGPRLQRGLLRLIDLGTRLWLRDYRRLERELGLPPKPNPLLGPGQHSPYAVLALFSPLLAAPQADWPARTHATGFPFFAEREGLSEELARFLDAGPAPVVFTLGSAAVGSAGDFFAQSAAAAQALGRRAVLLVGSDPGNTPGHLPDSILPVAYAPHAAIFPYGGVTVHQGGIGTTAEAMRAGRPMLVVPFSHDQPDNAQRLCRLGIARRLSRGAYRADRVAAEIHKLLEIKDYSERASEVGRQVSAENGRQAAADVVDAVLASPPDVR